MKGLTTVVVALAFLASGTASAQNLIQNPDFDSSTNGWFVKCLRNTFSFNCSGGTDLDWSAIDADAQPDSGSAAVTRSDYEYTEGAAQCLPAVAGQTYQVAADIYSPSTYYGHVPGLIIEFYPNETCPPSQYPAAGESFFFWYYFGIYQFGRLTAEVTAPEDAQSMTINLVMTNAGAGTPVTAYFDNVSVEVAPWIFTDDFESGDTLMWSTSSP